MRSNPRLEISLLQGPSLLKNFGGDKPYCLRFDDVSMFTNRSTTFL